MYSCPSCAAEIPEKSNFCPVCGQQLSAELQPTRTYRAPTEQEPPAVAVEPSIVSDSSQHGQFLPGAKLAGRYRIVSRLGRGGMGEVYRADDLKLGHPVALKFLPARFADDRRRLESLYNEVRLARQVSHPNVCRVYDISEENGRHFLSMEYIDGEDLKRLLRRIGRLPGDKGLQVARQLCAGLAAAHDRGVLHRDLKPANVMIDGRGHVRIADFGLARTARELQGAKAWAGTPAYMAPEQLLRGETTVRSDVYSLGLILYESFTGAPAHKAASVTELEKMHAQSTPPEVPRTIAGDIDPAVEEVILRCLQVEPRDRPQSALAVAAALPGSDPLTAALAAGETPSPELVAAAGDSGAMSPRAVVGCFVAVVVGLVLLTLLSQPILERVGLVPGDSDSPRDIRFFTDEAKRILEQLGYDRKTRKQDDDAYGFMPAADGQRAIEFWYRTSEDHLVPNLVIQNPQNLLRLTRGRVTYDDPPLLEPAMTRIRLRLQPETGDLKLKEFRAVSAPDSSPEPDRDWVEHFGELAGVDLANDFTGEIQTGQSLADADRTIVWKPKEDSPRKGDIESVAAEFDRGWPIAFHIKHNGDDTALGDAEKLYLNILFLVLMVPAVLMVPRNLRLGRGDRSGAFRVAAFTFSLMMLRWLVWCSHVPGMEEASLLFMALARALFWAAMYWLLYLAFEPHVRRRSPRALISWSRLLAGQFKDPLVARDLVIGVVAGVAVSLLHRLHGLADPTQTEFLPLYGGLLGTTSVLYLFLSAVFQGLEMGLVVLLLVCLLQMVLRRQRTAVVAAAAILALTLSLRTLDLVHPSQFAWNLLFRGLELALVAVILLRCGFLPVVAIYCLDLLLLLPLTSADVWYATGGYFAMTAVIALTAYAGYKSLGGKPLFHGAVLETQ